LGILRGAEGRARKSKHNRDPHHPHPKHDTCGCRARAPEQREATSLFSLVANAPLVHLPPRPSTATFSPSRFSFPSALSHSHPPFTSLTLPDPPLSIFSLRSFGAPTESIILFTSGGRREDREKVKNQTRPRRHRKEGEGSGEEGKKTQSLGVKLGFLQGSADKNA
jgi:hypothetical protein